MGKRPYGYQAKGEIAVFIFFGLLNVLGGLYLQTQYIGTTDIIAAITIGIRVPGVISTVSQISP